MDVLFQPCPFSSTDVPWIALAIFLIGLTTFVLALLCRASKFDRTGWDEEVRREEEWRRYQVHPPEWSGSIPKRVRKQLLRKYLSKWYGVVHGLVVLVSGALAIGFAIARHLP